MADARISTALPAHPKTKKLVRKLGAAGAWYLVRLFLWAAENRSTGDLSGLSNEDLELAIDFDGEEGSFMSALVSVGFVDGAEGGYTIHDWAEHNPWAAGSEKRSEKAKWAALCKQHGRAEAATIMPEYARRLLESASSTQVAESSCAPSPSPSPSPNPSPLPTPEESADKSALSRGKTFKTYLQECKDQGVKAIPEGHSIFKYAEDAGISSDLMGLCWLRFKEEHITGARKAKKQKDWPQTFANCVKDNWYGFWYVKDGVVTMSSKCEMYKTAIDAQRARGE